MKHNPVLPMEDTYIGTLINAANMEQHMSMSMSFCMGLHAWFKTEIEDNKDVCFLRGLTLAHKYKDPKEMKRLFRSVVSGDTACNNYKPFSFSNIRVFYGPRFWHDDRRDAWKRNIENFRIFVE